MTLYLNNQGSRWITRPAQRVLVYHAAEGYCKMRTIEYFSSLGNYAVAHLKYKGKMIRAYLEDCNGVTVFFVDYKEKYRS